MGRRLSAAVLAGIFLGSACAPVSRPSTRPGAPAPAVSEVERERRRLTEEVEQRRARAEQRVRSVGRRILSAIPNAPSIEFLLIPGDRSINAGATFGQVGVTSGMMSFIENDDQLAAVLGHETAHITEGHVTKGMIGGLAVTALAILVETQAPGLGRTAGSVGQLFLNNYTQSQEREADQVGIRYTYRAGYDPMAAARVQERLAVEVPESMASSFFSTHPSSVERMVSARKRAQGLLAAGEPPERQEALALAATHDGLPAEVQTALEGRSEERRFIDEAGASRPDGESSPAPPPPGLTKACSRASVYVDMAQDEKSTDEKERLYQRAIAACPDLAEAHAGLGRILQKRGENDRARAAFLQALEIDPDHREAREALDATRP